MPRTSKRLIYSLAIVLAWLGFVVEGSHALFNSSAILASNAITTGTAGLEISNSQNGSSTTYASSRPGFALNLNPGESDTHYFFLKNVSSGNTDFDISVNGVEADGASATLEQGVQLEFTPVDSTGNPTGSVVSQPLQSILSSSLQLNVIVPANTVQRFRLKTTLSGTYAGQGDTTGYDLSFTGVQRAS